MNSAGQIVGVHTNGGCTATGGTNSGIRIARIRQVSNVLGTPEPNPTIHVFTSTDVPKSIPDNNATGTSSVIFVPAGLDLLSVLVSTNITHTFRGDLVIQVIAPNGQAATLANRAGGSADNFVANNLNITELHRRQLRVGCVATVRPRLRGGGRRHDQLVQPDDRVVELTV